MYLEQFVSLGNKDGVWFKTKFSIHLYTNIHNFLSKNPKMMYLLKTELILFFNNKFNVLNYV